MFNLESKTINKGIVISHGEISAGIGVWSKPINVKYVHHGYEDAPILDFENYAQICRHSEINGDILKDGCENFLVSLRRLGCPPHIEEVFIKSLQYKNPLVFGLLMRGEIFIATITSLINNPNIEIILTRCYQENSFTKEDIVEVTSPLLVS